MSKKPKPIVPPDVIAAIERMLIRADTAADRNLVRAWMGML